MSRPTKSTVILLATVVFLHIIAALMLASGSMTMTKIALGIVLGFIGLITTWAVLGTNALVERVFVFLATSWLYGATVNVLLGSRVGWLSILSAMFAVAGATIAVPLLVMRWYGWRVSSSSAWDPKQQQFSLLRLMGAVAVAAILFAIGRLAGPPIAVGEIDGWWPLEMARYGTAFGFPGLVAIFLAFGRTSLGVRLVSALVAIVAIHSVGDSSGWMNWEILGILPYMAPTQVLVMVAGLLLCRWLGIELRRIQPASAKSTT